jgi:hypothetical protein
MTTSVSTVVMRHAFEYQTIGSYCLLTKNQSAVIAINHMHRFRLCDEVMLSENQGLTPVSDIGGEVATVIGVGRHKLWIQSRQSGKVCGYTRDSLLLLAITGSLRVQSKKDTRLPVKERDSDEFDSATDFESVDAFMGALKTTLWTRDLDEKLTKALAEFSEGQRVHPLALTYEQLKALCMSIPDDSFFNLNHVDLYIRMVFLLTFNDVMAPLIPFLISPAGDHGTSKHVQDSLRRIMLTAVKCDLMYVTSHDAVQSNPSFRICFPILRRSFELYIEERAHAHGRINAGSDEPSSTLYIQDEESAAKAILAAATEAGSITPILNSPRCS